MKDLAFRPTLVMSWLVCWETSRKSDRSVDCEWLFDLLNLNPKTLLKQPLVVWSPSLPPFHFPFNSLPSKHFYICRIQVLKGGSYLSIFLASSGLSFFPLFLWNYSVQSHCSLWTTFNFDLSGTQPRRGEREKGCQINLQMSFRLLYDWV